MAPTLQKPGFWNYPEPLQGQVDWHPPAPDERTSRESAEHQPLTGAVPSPDVPYTNNRKSAPALRGRLLVASALIMEWVACIRWKVWMDAGFGSLRHIAKLIEEYEPWFDPEIVSVGESLDQDDVDDHVFGDDHDVADEEGDGKDGDHEAGEHTTQHVPAGPSPPAASETAGAQGDGASETTIAKYPQARYYSVADYHALYLSGEITPLDVAKALLPLIRRDTNPPGEHSVAFFETRENLVLDSAEASTKRYNEGKPLGPLDGVPTAVKDEYDMDGYATCLGSRNDYTGKVTEAASGKGSLSSQAQDSPARDTNTAWLVRKIALAGAVIIGKTSMHEFGLDTTGNNPWYGTPRNPYNPHYYTGGSSSGTGYAVAAGLIPIGLGSDGGGSIRIPSSMCGIFGLKPTHGRLSHKPNQNTCVTCSDLGPMAADVASLATVFEVIGQPHPSSTFRSMRTPLRLVAPPTQPKPPSEISTSEAHDSKDPRAPRVSAVVVDQRLSSSPLPSPDRLHMSAAKLLGVYEDWFARAEPAVQRQCRVLMQRLCDRENYAVVPIRIPFVAEGQTAHAMTVLTDAATLLPPDEAGRLTAANRILLAIGRTTPSTDYLLAQKLRAVLMRHLAWLWARHPGMLIVTPTTACAGWAIRGGRGELQHGMSDGYRTLQSMEYVWMANFCGLPSVSVPAGFVDGEPGLKGGDAPRPLARDYNDDPNRDPSTQVPVGLMAMGEWCAEERLLQFAKAAETVGEELRRRPPVWVDVMEKARAAQKQQGEEDKGGDEGQEQQQR